MAIPADQILTVSSSNLAKVGLLDGADESASHEECTQRMTEVVEQFKLIRFLTARLRKACSHTMHIYVPAHHTTGASWDTVAQLYFQEEWNSKMLVVQDGFTLLKTWEEKVTAAVQARQAPVEGRRPPTG